MWTKSLQKDRDNATGKTTLVCRAASACAAMRASLCHCVGLCCRAGLRCPRPSVSRWSDSPLPPIALACVAMRACVAAALVCVAARACVALPLPQADHPCARAPRGYRFEKDDAQAEMHSYIISLYTVSSQGKLNPELYREAAETARRSCARCCK